VTTRSTNDNDYGSPTVTRELLLSQLSCFVTDVLIEGEEVLGMRVREGEGDEARSNKGDWKLASLGNRALSPKRKKSIITVATGVIVDGAS